MDYSEDDIDPKAFWTGIGARPIGATIVTAAANGVFSGFLGLSFAHVSAAPPVVLVSVSRKTGALSAIRGSECFAVNVLSTDGEDTARAFGGGVPDAERFASGSWDRLVTGSPILTSAAAAFDCRVRSIVEEAEACVVFGLVVGLRLAHDRGATLAYRGSYQNCR